LKVKFVIHGAGGADKDTTVALLSVPRSITLDDLRRRVSDSLQQQQGAADTASSNAVHLRYRLPGEADGLVLLASDDDLALMLEEYDQLQVRAPQGGPQSRLHVYCSSRSSSTSSGRSTPDVAGTGSPASPRSVLLSWQAAAKQGRASKAADDMHTDAPSSMQERQHVALPGERRTASRSPAPASPECSTGMECTPSPATGGLASASMLMLAEAVVANVLGDDAAAQHMQQLNYIAALHHRQHHLAPAQGCMLPPPQPPQHVWTPATPVRCAPAPVTPMPQEHSGSWLAQHGVPTIAADDMELGPRLGDGTYAVVHAGWWRGASVAVKILRRSTGSSGAPSGNAARGGGGAQQQEQGYARAVDAFAREAALLARLQHPNVLALYGVVAPTGPEVPPAAVLELMPHGSLTQSLRCRRLPPCTRTAACLALGAARAMQHLHAQSPPVVHFDLKADNLLVDWRDPGQPVCKLSDLGLACPLTSALATAATGRGTLWWMAPELFPGASPQLQARIGTPLDVFSFGIVLWEIATSGSEPYAPGTPPEAVIDAVRRGLRPGAPLGCDPRWVALMNACWAGDPACRPTFDTVVRQLVTLLRG